MTWLLLAMVAISAPMAYLLKQSARKAVLRRRMRKLVVRFTVQTEGFTKGILSAQQAMLEFGHATYVASEKLRKVNQQKKKAKSQHLRWP